MMIRNNTDAIVINEMSRRDNLALLHAACEDAGVFDVLSECVLGVSIHLVILT